MRVCSGLMHLGADCTLHRPDGLVLGMHMYISVHELHWVVVQCLGL